ncbi:hypothetical protein MRX96_004068 [Rhipicephalus microplus]
MAEFDACMRKLSSITDSDELALASTRHELDILCSKWKAGHRCVDEHMSRCSDRLKQILYNDVVHGTRQVMNELCSPGRMQNVIDEAISNAACSPNLCATASERSSSPQRRDTFSSVSEGTVDRKEEKIY